MVQGSRVGLFLNHPPLGRVCRARSLSAFSLSYRMRAACSFNPPYGRVVGISRCTPLNRQDAPCALSPPSHEITGSPKLKPLSLNFVSKGGLSRATGDVIHPAERGCFGHASRALTLRAAAAWLANRPYRRRPFSAWRRLDGGYPQRWANFESPSEWLHI